MAGVSRKSDKDRPLDFKGFLKDLNDWDYLRDEKDQKMKGQFTDAIQQNAGKVDQDKGPPKKIAATEAKIKSGAISGVISSDYDKHYRKYLDAVGQPTSSFLSDEKFPDAASEKELGNQYFKQKKYVEAIECYSRSIALSPSSVAFANRAMAYIKVKRFDEAENDCTEALNLDDRYVKAYSRRATARKELGKFKASMEDSDFAIRLEPNNQELRKLYTEAKELLEKGLLRNSGKVDEDKGPPNRIAASEAKKKSGAISEVISSDYDKHDRKYSDAVGQPPSSFLSYEKLPDAASEKEQGNQYLKQKKYLEAIECYSRSIAFSPTSVAFANRAMAYIKVKRFEEAENDCTEALNLDDRYVKAYSRRATARKELGKFKASMEDSNFAIRLEPNNQELRKQYTEAKELLEKENTKKNSGTLKSSSQRTESVQNVHPTVSPPVHASNGESKHGKPVVAVNHVDAKGMIMSMETTDSSNGVHKSTALNSTDRTPRVQGVGGRKQELDPSMQDLASRAASRIMGTAVKNISAPKSAYEFEVSWRALSGDSDKQACLLKAISPTTLPQIFKNALSAPMLIEIIKCTATLFKEDAEYAVSILDNLTKVPRFDMIVMCLSAVDCAEIRRLWEQVFSAKDIRDDLVEILSRLRPKFCFGK